MSFDPGPAAGGGLALPGPMAGPGGEAPPAFTTPVPVLAGADGAGAGTTSPLALLGRALPAVLAVLVALAAPFWALASRRLADASLAGAGARCPDGLDRDRPRPAGKES